MKWNILSVALLLPLLACAGPGGLSSQTATMQTATVQTDTRRGADLPPARGETYLTVRTFVVEAGTEREISGASCEAASDFSSAKFQSPARLALPDLGPQTPVVSVSCTDGTRRGTLAARARLQSGGGGGGYGQPAIGVSVGTGGYSSVGLSFGRFYGGGYGGAPQVQRAVYPELRIVLGQAG
jgi:hypothetical protein